jgi:hypothetical protein
MRWSGRSFRGRIIEGLQILNEVSPHCKCGLIRAVEIPPQTLILKLIDEWWISEIFQEIDKALERQGNEKATFSQIRNEFIQGSKDYNFVHRLKVFVQ